MNPTFRIHGSLIPKRRTTSTMILSTIQLEGVMWLASVTAASLQE